MTVDNGDPNVSRESHLNAVRNVAVVGLLNGEGQILLVRTKRFPDHWQPIGGGMKPQDASPRHTLVRELREETGLSVQPSDLATEIQADYDFGEGTVFFFSLQLRGTTHFDFDTSELAEWSWFDIREALRLRVFPATAAFLAHLVQR